MLNFWTRYIHLKRSWWEAASVFCRSRESIRMANDVHVKTTDWLLTEIVPKCGSFLYYPQKLSFYFISFYVSSFIVTYFGESNCVFPLCLVSESQKKKKKH